MYFSKKTHALVLLRNFIKCTWGSSESLSNKPLTLKLVLLLALTTGSRASAIPHLDKRYTIKGYVKYIFKLYKLYKSRICEKAIPNLEFHEHSEVQNLCVVTAVDE